jgi:hypothetical protein
MTLIRMSNKYNKMSLLSENIIPGNHGKIFSTNATKDKEMEKIKLWLQKIDGVKEISIIEGVYPREFIVYTSKLISIVTIEDAVKKLDLHAIPKGLFKLSWI